jgi:TolB-like protein
MTPGAVEDGAGEVVADLFRSALSRRGFSVKGLDETLEATKKAMSPEGGYNESLAVSVGKALEADLVILGVVVRHEDRVGGRFSVDKPASVAFSVAVINVAEGRAVWKARFDKAQKDLFSDVLDIRTFVRGGMTWQTASQLADMGVEDMLDRAALRPFVKTRQTE